LVTLVGTGALATLLAARLGAVVPVTVLGSWAEALAVLRDRGAALETDEGSRVASVAATSDPADCRGARLAVVVVKAGATARAAERIRSFLAPDGIAVTLQNGLGNVEILAAALGTERVVTGSAELGASLVSPGRARAGGGKRVFLASHPRAAEVEALLVRAGFEVAVVPDADRLLWEKLSATAPLLPLTALLGVPNGEILRRPSALRLLDAAAGEIDATAARAGIGLGAGGSGEAARRVARATAGNLSSMLQDVRRGAPTEVDAINGAVVAAARRLGVPARVNETLWLAVRALGEKGAT
jgi:2-dehydropantoate 2-reductase